MTGEGWAESVHYKGGRWSTPMGRGNQVNICWLQITCQHPKGEIGNRAGKAGMDPDWS